MQQEYDLLFSEWTLPQVHLRATSRLPLPPTPLKPLIIINYKPSVLALPAALLRIETAGTTDTNQCVLSRYRTPPHR